MPLSRSWDERLVTNFVVEFDFDRKVVSASLQDVFADQLLPQRQMSEVLSLLVIQLVRVAEPSLRISKSLSRIQSRIPSPR